MERLNKMKLVISKRKRTEDGSGKRGLEGNIENDLFEAQHES
jgi:hypothetical protein